MPACLLCGSREDCDRFAIPQTLISSDVFNFLGKALINITIIKNSCINCYKQRGGLLRVDVA